MDPVSAVGLASACAGLATKLASTVKGISEFTTHMKEADKSISFLASHLGLLEIVVEELQRWLESDPRFGSRSKDQLASAIKSCGIIVADIADHVDKVKPGPEEETSTFKQKVKLIWNDTLITEHRQALSHSLQAFQILVSLTQIADRRVAGFDELVETSGVREVVHQSSEDAKSILTAMIEVRSRPESSFVDDGCNLDVELSIDEEIARSGPYLRQYRKLMRLQYTGSLAASPAPNSSALIEDHPKRVTYTQIEEDVPSAVEYEAQRNSKDVSQNFSALNILDQTLLDLCTEIPDPRPRRPRRASTKVSPPPTGIMESMGGEYRRPSIQQPHLSVVSEIPTDSFLDGPQPLRSPADELMQTSTDYIPNPSRFNPSRSQMHEAAATICRNSGSPSSSPSQEEMVAYATKIQLAALAEVSKERTKARDQDAQAVKVTISPNLPLPFAESFRISRKAQPAHQLNQPLDIIPEVSAIPPDTFLDGKGPRKTSVRKLERELNPKYRGYITERERREMRLDDIAHRSFAKAVFEDRTRRRRAGSPVIPKFDEEDVAKTVAGSRLAAAVMAEREATAMSGENKQGADGPNGQDEDRPRRRRRSTKNRTVSTGEESDGAKPRRRRSTLGPNEFTNPIEIETELVPGATHRPSHSSRFVAGRTPTINNPRLLATIEDAIRRLILPDLEKAKREQSKRTQTPASAGTITSELPSSREDAPSRSLKLASNHHQPEAIVEEEPSAGHKPERGGSPPPTAALAAAATPDDIEARERRRQARRSQTSMLVEYFESGESTPKPDGTTPRKPAVRVRLTPARKPLPGTEVFRITVNPVSKRATLARELIAPEVIGEENGSGSETDIIERKTAPEAPFEESPISDQKTHREGFRPLPIPPDGIAGTAADVKPGVATARQIRRQRRALARSAAPSTYSDDSEPDLMPGFTLMSDFDVHERCTETVSIVNGYEGRMN